MTIYLIGYKSSGKTTLGTILANKLNLRFIDLDEFIEKNYNINIPELFSNEGELHFRQLERKAFFEIKNKDNLVLSTGGGFPCWFNNLELLKISGFTVYLDTDSKILYQRMKTLSDTRPVLKGLKGLSLKNHIKNLKKKNDPVYQQAHIIYNPEKDELEDLIFKLNTHGAI